MAVLQIYSIISLVPSLDVVALFGMESILIYAGLLLKKRLVLYSPRIESLIKVCRYIYLNSSRNSPRQSVIAEGFVEANRVFIGDYFLAKYIFSLQFLILISGQNYRLQTRDITCTCQGSVCTYYKQSDLLYILVIPFLFAHVAMEQALLSRHISSYRRNSVTSHI